MQPYEALQTCKGVVDAFTSLEGDIEPLQILSETVTDPNTKFVPQLPQESDLKDLASLLLSTHMSRDPRRYSCIQELCKIIRQCLPLTLVPSFASSVWYGVHTSDVVRTVIAIARDKETYVLDGGEKETYLHQVIRTLTVCLIGYSQALLNARGQFLAGSKAILKKLDGLYAFLWDAKHRLLAVTCKDTTSETLPDVGVLPRRILRLVSVAACLHTFCYMTSPDLLANKLIHITYFCWLRTRLMVELKSALVLTRMTFVIHPHRPDPQTCLLQEFLEEVVCETDSENAFLDMLSHIIGNNDILDVELFSVIDFFHHMAECAPCSCSPSKASTAEKLLISLSKAWQRQVCLGKPREDTYLIPSAATVNLLEAMLKMLRFYLMTDPQSLRTADTPVAMGQEYIARQMLLHGIPTKLVFLTAYCLRLPNKVLSDDILVSLRVVLLYLKKNVVCPPKPYAPPQMDDTRRQTMEALRNVWYPTWQCVSALPSPHRDTERSASITDVKSLLAGIRQLCQFDMSDPTFQKPEPYRPPVSEDTAKKWWKARGCHWAECLCAVEPCHRLKLCKNCWQVLYCSSRCQTLDWQQGGHRDVCLRRNV